MNIQSNQFSELWEALKYELNLTDKDLDVGYKVQIDNGSAILGYLGRGKINKTPTYYPHPSAAQRAADSFLFKNKTLKAKVLVWEPSKDSAFSGYEK